MTPGSIAKSFGYSSVQELCFDTDITIAEWIYITKAKRIVPRVRPIINKLKQRNFELYEADEKEAEENYWARQKIIKEMIQTEREKIKMEWINIEDKAPYNDEEVLTYDGKFYCLLRYYNRKPNLENFNWSGKGFYSYNLEIGDYKVEGITYWSRLKEPEKEV